MIDPIAFSEWMSANFAHGGALNATIKSRELQKLMADAVLEPRVTIMSGAVAATGINELQARMTLALVYAFESGSEVHNEQAF